ncbi:MAG: metallophosphoesterase [Oscillospiraceae bacterium]|nr:metallophosphoesterase [Oscillospiraceae bacterium]
MPERNARILRPQIEAGRRVIVVSDIHGNLPYLQGLLKKIGFGGSDLLIANGDFLEKGPQCLETLRLLMHLQAEGRAYVIAGNCDGWAAIYDYISEEQDEYLFRTYVRTRKTGILREMCAEVGLAADLVSNYTACEQQLYRAFTAEWEFIAALPHAIDTPLWMFAHAAADPSKPLEAHTANELRERDAFLRTAPAFPKWLVVGHYPVVLYGGDRVCASPVVDRERKIISIDGGCVLKDDGQLNAVIIPDIAKTDFTWDYYDPFPVRRANTAQTEGERSYYIRWGDSQVQVLERGEEFSRCRHVRTGYEMDILTKYLFTGEEITGVNDCTDLVLGVEPGDELSIVETTSRGWFVKKSCVSGWYFGQLEEA